MGLLSRPARGIWGNCHLPLTRGPLGGIVCNMQLLDVLAALLVALAAVAFSLGALALVRSNDVESGYFLIVGVVALRAAVQIARPEAKA